jgi:hypothetical protein
MNKNKISLTGLKASKPSLFSHPMERVVIVIGNKCEVCEVQNLTRLA